MGTEYTAQVLSGLRSGLDWFEPYQWIAMRLEEIGVPVLCEGMQEFVRGLYKK